MIKKLAGKFLSIIFPKSCLICNKIISGGSFCVEDWNKLHFLQNPACNICFWPFEFKVDDEMICGKCLQKRPEYFKALAVLNYDETSRTLITKFKYFDQTNLAKYFSELMFKQAEEILPDIDFIAPIPLHKFRIIKRKYNQSALLAKNIAALSNKKVLLDLLIRTKNNKPQALLSQKARKKNVAGIFKVKEKYYEEILGKNILLIDDVITTGATIESCCKVLKKAGAKKIYVLTLAKTTIN
ncbi:MAG: ComF family protein [Pseudomonadota bacterium]